MAVSSLRFLFWLFGLVLLQEMLALAQNFSPSPPAAVVQSIAKQNVLQQDSTNCDNACAKLSASLSAQVFLGKSGDFVIWDQKQSSLTPACRVEPASHEDISTIIKTVVEENCHFAIKGGGHDRTAGSSNADGGVTIDLVKLKAIDISSDRKSVKIGAGNRWLDVYSALEPEGLMVIGGRVADVGVSGLLLGGGISFYSARHGYGCDSIISFDIVLPDGTFKVVDHKSSPDLYFALRGAGNSNFGLVTSFTLETIPLPNTAGLWDASKIYSWDKVPELLEQHHKFYTESMDKDFDIGGFHIHSYFQPYDAFWAMTRHLHTKHTSNNTWPDVFSPYSEIEGLSDATTIQIAPFSNISIEIAEQNPYGFRNIYGTSTYRPSVEFETKLLEIFVEEITKVKDVEEIQPNVVMHPLSRQMMKMMSKNGGNALGLSESNGPLIILNVAWKWKNAADDQRNMDAYYRFMQRTEAEAKKMGLWHPWKYVNYAESTQDVYGGYGAENLHRLKRIQRKVDPARVFTSGGLASGFFKLNAKDEEVDVDARGKMGRKSEL